MSDESVFWQEVTDKFVRDAWADRKETPSEETVQNDKDFYMKVAPEALNPHLDQPADLRKVLVCRMAMLNSLDDHLEEPVETADCKAQELYHCTTTLYFTLSQLHELLAAIIERDGGTDGLDDRMWTVIELNVGISREDLQLLDGSLTVRQLLMTKPDLVLYL